MNQRNTKQNIVLNQIVREKIDKIEEERDAFFMKMSMPIMKNGVTAHQIKKLEAQLQLGKGPAHDIRVRLQIERLSKELNPELPTNFQEEKKWNEEKEASFNRRIEKILKPVVLKAKKKK